MGDLNMVARLNPRAAAVLMNGETAGQEVSPEWRRGLKDERHPVRCHDLVQLLSNAPNEAAKVLEALTVIPKVEDMYNNNLPMVRPLYQRTANLKCAYVPERIWKQDWKGHSLPPDKDGEPDEGKKSAVGFIGKVQAAGKDAKWGMRRCKRKIMDHLANNWRVLSSGQCAVQLRMLQLPGIIS